MAINKNEVFITTRDDFVKSIVVTDDDTPWIFRDNGAWVTMDHENSPRVYDDMTLYQVDPENVDDLVEVWDSSMQTSTNTGIEWLRSELEDYLK